MPMTAPFRERTLDGSQGRVLYTGAHANDAAALTHCAANGIDLTRADLSGRTLDGADVSGLTAPKCDLRNASCRNWVANRLVGGRTCELSASMLQAANFEGAVLTVANLACTQPTRFRAETGPNTRLRGCDWSLCPDVIELPVARAARDRVGRVIALRNGNGWKVHAGIDGVLGEASAKAALSSRPEYAAAMAWLDSAEGMAAKATIDARPAGTGAVLKPSQSGGAR